MQILNDVIYILNTKKITKNLVEKYTKINNIFFNKSFIFKHQDWKNEFAGLFFKYWFFKSKKIPLNKFKQNLIKFVKDKNQTYYFSISDSYDYCVFICCNQPIGIDLEKNRKLEFENYVKRIIKTNDLKLNKKSFFKFWTSYEAYLKCSNLLIKKTNESFRFNVEKILNNNFKNHSFQTFDNKIKNFTLCVCNKSKPIKVKFKTINSLTI